MLSLILGNPKPYITPYNPTYITLSNCLERVHKTPKSLEPPKLPPLALSVAAPSNSEASASESCLIWVDVQGLNLTYHNGYIYRDNGKENGNYYNGVI